MGADGRDEVPGRGRRLLRLIRRGALAFAAGSVASLALRLWILDDGRFIKWNYYIPLVLLVPAGLVAAALAKAHPALRAVFAAAILAMAVPALMHEQPRFFHPEVAPPAPTADPRAFTVMTYNVMGYHGGEGDVYRTIAEAHPDILCLVEGTFANRAPVGVVETLGDEYHWAVGDRLSIASRFPIKESKLLKKTHGRIIMRAVVEIDGREVSVILADIWVPRLRIEDQVFPELGAFVEMETGPVVLTGDFNTPRGSVWIQRCAAGLTDVLLHETAPHYLATWPRPFPLWQIDHMFCGNGLGVLAADIPKVAGSDHYPLLATLQLPEKSASPKPAPKAAKSPRQKAPRRR